jgi:hypothetical protein
VSKPAETAAFGQSRHYAARHFALFKTGAFNRSATHPAPPFPYVAAPAAARNARLSGTVEPFGLLA